MIDTGGPSRGDELERGPTSVSMIGAADEEGYDPGWLGVVLRWPIRVAAVVVIMPVQVVRESAKAAGRAVGEGLRRGGRVLGTVFDRCAGRPARWVGRQVGLGLAPEGRAVAWMSTRVLWWPLRWMGRGAGRGIAAFWRGSAWVGHRAGAGVGVVLRGMGHGVMWVLRPFGRGVALALVRVAAGLEWLGRVLARVGRYVFMPIALLGRGIWFVVKLLGGWLVGLFHVIGEGLVHGWRVGAKVGRGFVWMWTRVVWHPLRWVGRGLRTGWLSVWRPFRDACKAVAAPIRRKGRVIRVWYRQEISGPIRSAVRAARRDVRRAIGRR